MTTFQRILANLRVFDFCNNIFFFCDSKYIFFKTFQDDFFFLRTIELCMPPFQICVFSIYNFFPAFSSSSASGWVLAFEILKVASLASTSFIEEQHQVGTEEVYLFLGGTFCPFSVWRMSSSPWQFYFQTFYFLLVTSYCLLAFRALRARAQEESPPRRDLLWTLLFVLPMLRVARKWNQVRVRKRSTSQACHGRDFFFFPRQFAKKLWRQSHLTHATSRPATSGPTCPTCRTGSCCRATRGTCCSCT